MNLSREYLPVTPFYGLLTIACSDRWMGPGRANTGGATSNYAFLTFLHGPRSCIGQQFSKAEFACLLAGWVQAFDTVLEDPNMKIEVQSGITSRPKGGLPVVLTPVQS